ncbi:MAG TPA: YEATS-associated helix-containing protein [Pyrinomonadaceae bacterium]|nr:YEATS-associated helix-containing protein [Pyrinomonadaceae bacterium]
MQDEVVAKAAQVQTAWYVALLILIMILAGCLGGVVNFFQAKSDDPARADLRHSLVVGVAAAFLVPLFLQMISSTILSTGAANPLELFIFAGFCIVAAISSKAFISSLSERILKDVKEAKSASQKAEAAAADAQGTALEAKGTANSAENKVGFALASPGGAPAAFSQGAGTGTRAGTGTGGASPEDTIEQLMEEYNHIRETQKPSPARTDAMTRVIRQMSGVAPSLQEFDASALKETANRGRRLAAYASLYAMPDFQLLPELVESVAGIKDEPFAQYWGILSIGKVIGGRDKSQVPAQVVEQLRQLSVSLSAGTDRKHELSRVLKQLGVES